MSKLFETIVGEKLSAITFVADYWQLQFDGPSINALTSLDISSDGWRAKNGDDQFRNLICGQIGKTVASVTFVEQEAVTIRFQDQSSITISLKPDDYRGPEAMVFYSLDLSRFMVV